MGLYCKGKLGAGLVPYLLAQGIFAFAYFVYVFRFSWNLFVSGYGIEGVLLLILFHIPFLMSQIAYFQCSFTDPGGIPPGFPEAYESKIDRTEGDGESSSIAFIETNKKGERRRCSKCSRVKPDRSHHCSSCNRCILKMDHHCPWVNNCVGFHNYKFFILFLTWTTTTCLVIAASFLKEVINFFTVGKDSDVLVVSMFIIALVFGLALFAFATTHYMYILSNRTTIEALEKSSKRKENIYNLGKSANFVQVFGTNRYLWFVPVFTSLGNGLWFPQNPSAEDNSLIV